MSRNVLYFQMDSSFRSLSITNSPVAPTFRAARRPSGGQPTTKAWLQPRPRHSVSTLHSLLTEASTAESALILAGGGIWVPTFSASGFGRKREGLLHESACFRLG